MILTLIKTIKKHCVGPVFHQIWLSIELGNRPLAVTLCGFKSPCRVPLTDFSLFTKMSKPMVVPSLSLNNGLSIPQLGLGTYKVHSYHELVFLHHL